MKTSRLIQFALLCAVASVFSSNTFVAEAATVPSGACLYALDSSAADAFQIAGATSVYSACGVVSESSSSSAFEMEGSETLYLQNHSQVSVVGSSLLSGQTKLWDTISNAQVQAVKVTSPGDPLASITAPTTGTIVSTSPASYDMNHKPTNNTFSPGVYCGGLTVGNTNGATFTVSPGVYVMAGGGLTLNSQAIVSGSGVTVYNTSSSGWGCSSSYSYTPVTISGQVTATLSAPTSGSLNGILFFGNRTGCSSPGSCQDQINGGSTVVLNGALYFKSDKLTITGSNASGYMMLVADKIYINGNSTFGTTGNPYDGITVSVSPTTSSLNGGQTQQFTATVNAANTAVTWSISPAGVGSIGSTGLYTAPATVTSPQTVTVTATSQADTSKLGSATVTLYPPVTVSVSPATATLYGGQTQQLTATVTNTGNTAVTWTISPVGTGTVNSTGLYTAPASITSATTVTVTATSQANTSKSASATVTLSPPVAVSVSPGTATLYGGQTQQLIATVTNTSNTAVTWTISPAGTGTVSASGLYTAPASIASVTTVTVTATSQANTTKSASATIALEPPIAVSVNPAAATLYGGLTQQLTATVTNTSNTAVTWSISPAGTGTVSSTGLYTAPASISSATTVTVAATSQANSSAAASATIALSPPVAVTVSPTTATLYGSQTQQFAATVINASNTAVGWTVSPVGSGTVSSTGLYTAPASIASPTTVTVTATSQANSTATASGTITLSPPVAVSVSPATATLYGGQAQQLTATVTNTGNTAVTWTVSPAGTGTVSASGLYTAPAGISSATSVTVTATSQANTSAIASASITLSPPVAVSVSPPTATLNGGQTQQLTATVTNSSNTGVTWTILPAGIGMVSASGLYTAPATISATQTVVVTATSLADATQSASATITLIGASGTLSETFGQLLSNIDLTKEGTADWAVFGPTNYYSYGVPLTRKASVTPLIPIPSAPPSYDSENWLDYPGPFSFEDGYPDVEESGILPVAMVTGSPSPEFDFVVPADTIQRTLKIYGSVDGSVQMTATLSDNSAPAIADSSLSNTGEAALNGTPYFYAISYNAASAGQSLTIKFIAPNGGNIYLNAATLTGSPVSVPPGVTSINPSSGSVGSMIAISGNNFGASQSSSTVTLGGVQAQVSSWSSSGQAIEVVVPVGAQSGPVQVVTNGGPSNTDVLFTLAPTVTNLAPSQGPVGTVVTITGFGFGASQGTGSVTFNGVTAIPSRWTDTQIVVPVPAGASTGAVAVTQGVAATSTPLFTVLNGAQGTQAPVLQIGLHDGPLTINLSSSINQDWVIWGADGVTPSAIRNAQANLISDVTILGGASPAVSGISGNLQYNYTWTNGTPTASGNISMTGIAVSGANSGFQLTAPADTTVRTLKIYSYGSGLQTAQVNASISDGSSPPATYTLPYVADYGNTLRVYSIDYRAASAGQTLTVQLVSLSSGVSIDAAVLSPHLPQVDIISPQEGQEFFQNQAAIPFGVDAMQFDSAVTSVGVSANGVQQLSLAPPFLSTWSPAQGHYSVQAQATDAPGLANTSDPIRVDVIGSGGSLSVGTVAPPTSGSTDLTSEGTADWILFGTPSNVVRKAGVGQLISNAKVLGDEVADEYQDYNSQFAFEDGSPNLQGTSVESGLTIFNGAVVNNGFEIAVKADTVPRTLRLYVGAEYGGGGKLKAYLSDGSAPVYVDTSLQATGNPFSVYTVYVIKFSAASAGQTLTVRWTMDSVTDSAGIINLYAATLDGQPAIVTGPAVTQISPTSGGLGTNVTISGTGFGASQGNSTVTFNGIVATPTSWSDTQIQVPAPASSNTGNVVVTVGGVASDPELFSMPPTITSLSATSVPVGGTLTLNGYNFGASQGSSTVWSYAGNATVLSWSDTQIQIVVPQLPSWACSDPVNCNTFVYIQTATGYSNSANFTAVSPVQLTPGTASMYAGQTQAFTLLVGGTPSSLPGYTTWSILPAGAGTIDQNGNYTAPAVIASQQVVTVSSTVSIDPPAATATATITLEPPIAVSISPTTSTLLGGQKLQFTATVANTPDMAVSWSVSPRGMGSIDASGLYTAPKTLSANQTITVNATSVANSSVSASAVISLSSGVNVTPPGVTVCAATGYAEERPILIDHTRVTNSDQVNFPFLFKSTDPAFATVANGGKVTSSTGADILFTLDPNGTERLDYEIQSYDPIHGQIVAWVRIPTLSHTSDTAIYLFYGNSSVSVPASNPAGVWDSNYQSVYHLDNVADTAPDSTANANYGITTNVAPANGPIAGAASFNGNISIIQLPAGVTGSSPRTISAWVNSASQTGCIYCSGLVSSSPYDQAFSLYANAQETGNVYLQTYGSDNFTGPNTLPLNTWNYVTLSYSGGTTTTSSMLLYINGALVSNYAGNWNTNATPNTYNGNFTIGLDPANNNLPFNGSIAELEVSNTARSSAWVQTEYQNQSSPSTFYTLYSAFPGNTGIIPSAISLYAGQAQQFAVATGACESTGVIWASPAGMPGTLSESGLYLAPSSIDTSQTFTLTATTFGNTSKTVSTTVTLLPAISLSVTPSWTTLTSGQTQQFTASVANASNSNVVWAIEPADVGSISSTGLYTAPLNFTSSQTVNITATSLADSTKSATASVMLSAPTPVLPVAISVTPRGSTLYGGQTQQLTAQVLNTANTAVTWQVSPSGAGSISALGLYTTPASISAQQDITIIVTSQADPTQSAVATIELAPTSCASNGYSYERSIVIDHSQVPNTDQTNFPFFFSTTDPLFASTANGGHVTNSNGADIIFSTDPNGLTALNYEFEKYDPVTGRIIAWVNVPTISHTADTILYVFYGNSSVTASQQNPAGVWDSNYGGVWHLAGNGTSVSTPDSTANGNNATAIGSPSVTQGPLGPGAALNGGSFDAGNNPSVLPTHTGTMSIWMDSNAFSSYAIPIGNGDTSGFPEYGAMFALDASGRSGYLTFNIDNTYWGDGNGVQIGPLLTDQWYLVTGTWDGNSVNLYENGVLVASTPQAIDASPSFDLRLGWGLNGSIQEGRVSGIARSADWTATEYHNESSPSTFYSLGSEGELISPSSVAVYASQSQQFTALRVCNAVTWSMPPGSPGQLTPSGLYTAPADITAQQTITVTATSQTTSATLATATVILMPQVSVSVSPLNPTLLENQSQQFKATVANSLNSTVTWSISPSGVGSIDAYGAYTAPSGVAAPQTVTVTATSQEDPTKSASTTITIAPAVCVSTGFGYQRAVIIDHTKVPNTDQTNFPFLFNTIDADLATTDHGGHVANANGYDIIFSLDPNGLTKLDHEVEQYNPATGQLTAWVRIPTLLHSADTVIYLFYGNPNITAPPANTTGVWDSNTQAVYHLGNLTPTAAPDSTIFANAGATNSITQGAGWIAGGAGFNGTDSYFQVASAAFPNYPTGQYSNIGTASFATSTTFASTFGVWFKTSAAGGGILAQVPATSCTAEIFGVCLFYGPTTPGYYDPSGWDSMLYVDTNGKLQNDGITSSTAYNDNNWHYAVTTHATDGTKILYVDGQNVGMREQDFPTGYSSAYSYFVGTAYTLLDPIGNWNWLYFNGSLDEVSVSDIPRSADWIKTQFNNQSSPSTFYRLSPVGSLTLAPLSGSLYASQTQQFVIAGQCGLTVNWSLSAGSPGTLSSSGLYTAPAIVSASRTVTITATNAATGTAIESATITLLPVPNPITLAANAAPPYTVGTNEAFTVRLQDQSGTPEAGIPVTFTITGANAAIATATTDSSGTATYSYTGSNSGTDSLKASAVVNGVAVTSSTLPVNWNLAAAPPVQASVTLLPQPTLGQGGLVGAFTDNIGAVIEPIAIGGPSRTFLVPAGATQLQLGIDDTYFSDNGGIGYAVNVNGTPVTVAPTTMPWTWVAGGLNGNLQYGFSDGTAPVVATTGLFAGQPVTIAYQSGTVSVGATGRPFTNANGDQTQITGTNIVAGLYFPTLYTTASAYPVGEPIDWSAVVTDGSGQPVAHTPVTFYISGVNPGQGSATTDSTGTATFAYAGAYSGPDTLLAQSGSLSSQTGNLVWQSYPAESSPGSVNLSLFATDLSLQAWNVYVTDASGNALANANVGFYVSGVDDFQSSGTTDITGHVTFDYFHAKPGPYTVVAVDSVNNTVVKSAPVSGTWTVPATGISNPSGSQISINVSTLTAIALPTNSVTLTTTITDSNGLTPTTSWTEVSGPGTVTFADPTQASTTATFSQAGVYVLQLYATDTNTSGSVQVTVTVNPPPVTNYDQGWFGSPLFQSQVGGIVPITVESGVTLTGGTLVYYPANNQFDVTVLNPNTVGGGQIGTFDATQLPNGAYVLELYATNSQGVSQYNDITVNVVGNYKPGRVTSTVTDLVVPATGLAISIQRSYDSLNAAQSSDFGHGWSLGTTVNLTVDAHNDVTFTLGGQTHTFFFTPQPFGATFFQLGTYAVAFTPDSGIHGTLTDNGQGCPLDFVLPSGSQWQCVGGGIYSPPGYIYTDPSGNQYAISAGGSLQSITDIGGNSLTVTANGITSSTGLNVPFVRDSLGRITKITDPQGNNYLYSYDSFGNLASVTCPGVTQASTYTYDPNHLYLSGTDFRNNPLPAAGYYGPTDTDINGLPLNGRLQSVSDGLGETTKYAYNLATNTTTITYPPDGSGNAGTATLLYDNLGNLLTSTDPLGHTTTNVYDATGNLLSVTDPLGHTNSYTYDAMGNRTTSTYPKTATSTNTTSAILYNAYSEPTASMDELGNVRMYNYDANFRPQSVTDTVNGKTATIISSLYSSDGLLQAVGAGVDIFTNPSAASSFTYDANGNMTSALDSFGHYKSFTYNSLGQLLTVTLPGTASAATPHATAQMSIRALGFLRAADSQSPSAPSASCSSYAPPGESTSSYTITYTSAMGSPPTTAVDSLGRTTSYIYDNNRNITSVTDPKGNVYTYAYDSLNRLIKIGLPTSPATYYTFIYDFRNNVLDAIDPSGHDRHNVYDAAGRLISVTLGFASANATTTSYSYYAGGKIQSVTDALNHSTNYTYDAADNLLSVQRGNVSVTYAYDDARNRISQTDGNGNTTHFQYDSRKRLQLVTFADQTTESLSYDDAGNVTNVIDRAGHSVSYAYDTNDHLCSLVQNNNPSASNNTSKYSYDAFGNLTAWTDQNGHQTTQAFDQLNRPVMKLLPDGIRGESAAYDLNNNLISLSKLKSGSATSTATNTYDSLDRLLSEVPDPGFNESTVSFTYTPNGLPATMTDGTGVTTYSYDSLDRLVTKATPEGALTYTYDAVGNVASMNSSNPNGASVGYTYDNLNRLSTVVDNSLPAGSNTTTYAYDPASNLATATYPSGLQAVFTYDHLNRLSQTTTPVSSYTYQRDPNGNLLSGVEQNGRTANWTYDGVNQLTNETVASAPSGANGTVSYGLDPVGNRLNQVSSLGPVSSASTTYSADDWAQSESYNDNGDVIVTGGKGYAYDSRSRLVSMNGGAVTVLYDGVGDRVAKSANGVITRYLVDDLSPTGYPQVVEELVNGAVARRYTYGLQRISESQVVNSAWTASFYQYDGRGTVRMLTNSAGAVTDSYEYDAFGNLLAKTGTTPNNYLYRGEQWDPDLSLYYLRARYYNPVTGHFMTQDPYPGEIHAPASLHRYRYASGNPVNNIDPSGRADLAEYAQISLRVVNLGLQVYNLGQSIQCLYGAEASSLNVLVRPQTAASLKQLLSFQFSAVTCGAAAVFSAYGVGEALEGFAPFPEPEGEPLPLDEEPVPNCGECFAAGTPVHTDHGNVPIEMIEVGDKVVARNSATGKLESEPVTALTPLHRDKLLEIRIEGEKDSLRPSTSHPFWMQRGDAQPSWVAAGLLRVGDLVESIQGEWRKITAITLIEQEQTVYNFTVDKDHDYFVGQTGFLVHNAGPCGCGPGSPLNWGNRIPHVMRHANDIPTRQIMHGVFADNPIDMVNQAWGIAGAMGLTPTPGGNGNWNYSVPFPEAGLGGGAPGAAAGNPVLDSIHIVTKPGCNDIVTAFPE